MKFKLLSLFAICFIHSSFVLAGQGIPPGAAAPEAVDAPPEPENKKARQDDNSGGKDSVSDEGDFEAVIRKAIRGNADELKNICSDRSQLPDWATNFIDENLAEYPGRDDFQFMLLCAAVKEREHGLLKLLAKVTNPDGSLCFGGDWYMPPLCFAAREGDIEAVRILVEDGNASVNFDPNDDGAALSEAAAGHHEEAVTYLLKKGADIEQEARLRGRPLHAQFVFGYASDDSKEVRLLLRHGADITSRSFGITPLHLAAYCPPVPNFIFELDHDDGFGLCVSMIESYRNKGFPADEVNTARNRIYVFLLCLKHINCALPHDVVRKIVADDEGMSKIWVTRLSRGQITASLACLEYMRASARYLLGSLSPLLDEIWNHIERDLRVNPFSDSEEFRKDLKELSTLFDPSNRHVVAQLIFFNLKSRLLKVKHAERTQLQDDNAPSPGELFRNIVRDRPGLTLEQAWREVYQILEGGSQAEDRPVPMDINNDNNVNATAPTEATQILPAAFLG